MVFDEIKPGDVLQHKSARGKFRLVVTRLGKRSSRTVKKGYIECTWLDDMGCPHRADFLPVELEPCESPSE
jgi:uncharacterized protein YodC (DUF2158 family)